MPKAGTGPQPKISSGSSTMFNSDEISMMLADRRVSPEALKVLLHTMLSTRNTEPANQICM